MYVKSEVTELKPSSSKAMPSKQVESRQTSVSSDTRNPILVKYPNQQHNEIDFAGMEVLQ